MTIKSELLKGTLDLLILRTLAAAPMHGWGIAQRIEIVSNERIMVRQGSLYPALHRLEREGVVRAEWAVAETGRSAKFYRLTTKGRKLLDQEERGWTEFVNAISQVTRPEPS